MTTFGEIVQLDDRTLMVMGQELVVAKEQPDVANVLLHRSGETLFMIDSGVTEQFRRFLREAVNRMGSWQRLVLLTTHGHVDHIGNNDLVDELAAERGVAVSHFVPAPDVPQMIDPRAYWRQSFDRLTGVVALPAPASLVAEKIVSLFQPLRPFGATTRTYEQLPLERISVGSLKMTGWTFADGAVKVLRSQGHCAGHVMVLLTDSQILHMSDELNGPCAVMHDADQVKLTAALGAAATMIEQQQVTTVTDGHAAAMSGPEAAVGLEQMLDRAVALNCAALTHLGGTSSVASGRFAADYADIAATIGVGNVNPNPMFSAMMSINTLNGLGFTAGQHRARRHRPALVNPAPTATGLGRALRLAAALPALGLWRLGGRARDDVGPTSTDVQVPHPAPVVEIP